MIMGFATGANVANVGAIATPLSTQYGVSLAIVGLFTTALFVTHATAMIPGGQAIDRFGARRLGLMALTIIVVGNATAVITSDTALLLAARAFIGVGTGVGFIAASTYIRAAGGTAFAQGLFGGIANAGGAAALAVVPQLQRWFEWRSPFVFTLVLAVVALAVLGLAPLRRGRELRGRPVHLGDMFQLIGDRRLHGFAAMQASGFGLSIIVGNWVSTLLEHHGYSTTLATGLGAVVLGLSIISRPLGGWIDRAYPSSTRTCVAVSLAACSAACLGLAASGPIWLAVCSALVLGIASGIPFAPAFTAGANARPDAPGAAVGLINMAGAVTILVVTPLIGMTFSLPGDGRMGFLVIAALWAAALLVVPVFNKPATPANA